MASTSPTSPSTSPFSGVPPGGLPTRADTILSGIFIPLFLLTGIYFHFRFFHAYSRKFIWSILCFGFCMARIVALSFRIAVVKHPTNKTLNIIAQVFIAAGVVILFFVNLQISRRFFGQLHPQHSVIVKWFVNFWALLIIPVLAMVITTVVQSFLTTNPSILSKDRKVRLVGSCFLVLLAFLPIPIVLLVLILKAVSPGGLAKEEKLAEGDEDPEADADEARNGITANGNGNEKEKHPAENPFPTIKGEPKTGFGPKPVGEREILETALIILIPGILLTFEQGVRCAQAFHVAKPGEKTPWYNTKPAFWVCIFGFELISIVIFGLAVLPRRFSHLRIV